MKLTGKCKYDFLDYYWKTKIKPLKMTICKKEDLEQFFDTISELFQNALIIEFFDSVNLRIGIDPYYDMQGTYRACVHTFGSQSMYRNVATNAAIEKANELYNNKL